MTDNEIDYAKNQALQLAVAVVIFLALASYPAGWFALGMISGITMYVMDVMFMVVIAYAWEIVSPTTFRS